MLKPEIKKLRLGVYAGDPNTALSLSRALGPLMDMARQDPRLELVLADPANLNWSWIGRCDAIFMEQPYTDQHVNCVGTARMLGVPVWVDWGDDLFHVNPENHALLVDPSMADEALMRENVGSLCEMASVVSVVTETLRATYAEEAAKRGAASKFVLLPEGCRWPAWLGERQKVITWRGLSSHDGDVASVLDELCDVAADKEFADWRWALFGTPSIKMQKRLQAVLGEKRLGVVPYLPTPWHFMHAWAALKPFLHIYPLPENEFNVCKPPSVWLEATAVGAAVIGPDLPEWSRCHGLIRYTPSLFGARLREELRKWDGGKPHPAVSQARCQVYPNETLAEVNKRRWAILNKLAGAGGKEVA